MTKRTGAVKVPGEPAGPSRARPSTPTLMVIWLPLSRAFARGLADARSGCAPRRPPPARSAARAVEDLDLRAFEIVLDHLGVSCGGWLLPY